MRCPLRYQIMLPMIAVVLATVLAASILNAYLAGRRSVSQIEGQLREVARTLSGFNFPLTDAVLRQMKGLSGADYALLDASSAVVASSQRPELLQKLPDVEPANTWQELSLGQAVRWGESYYFHAALRLPPRAGRPGSGELHILYPREGYRRAWQFAMLPPLVIGAGALVLVCTLTVAVAARVSRPMMQLRSQVERMAEGNFQPLPLPARDDEIQDLSRAVNRMAEMLTEYEREVRRTERLRTLSQLGGGIAHQMRNAATGARMALDIHAAECPLETTRESLDVAKRQLQLMERYMQRLLRLGDASSELGPHQAIDLGELVENLLPLLRPAARHADVDLQFERPQQPVLLTGDPDGLEQLAMNLLLNAIEAARSGAAATPRRDVTIEVKQAEAGRVHLAVTDSGPGPSRDVEADLFDAFITGKSHGVGLGLAIVRDVVKQHRGTIAWERIEERTRFTATLPRAQEELACVEAIGC